MPIKKIILAVGFFCIGMVAYAGNDDIAIGRYVTTANKPLSAQRDLLSQTIQVRFPQNIQTIGDAMGYLLRFSGYALVDESRQNDALKNTLKKPLPLVDREFGSMPLKDALTTLAGPAFSMTEDLLNREVNFQVKPNFQKKYK